MTREEHLLTVLNEEAVEIAQAVDKALRFGLQNHHPDRPRETNELEILTEYYQLQGVMDMLVAEDIIKDLDPQAVHDIKAAKGIAVRKYLAKAEGFGTVS